MLNRAWEQRTRFDYIYVRITPVEKYTALDCDRFDESNLVTMSQETYDLVTNNQWLSVCPAGTINKLLQFTEKGKNLCERWFRNKTKEVTEETIL